MLRLAEGKMSFNVVTANGVEREEWRLRVNLLTVWKRKFSKAEGWHVEEDGEGYVPTQRNGGFVMAKQVTGKMLV